VTLYGVLQGETDQCFRACVATVLQIDLDDLPSVDLDDPGWPIQFKHDLKKRYGARLEVLPRERLPAWGRWVAIIAPLDSEWHHALVCQDERILFDPSGRYGQRPITAHHLISGVRIHEPGT